MSSDTVKLRTGRISFPTGSMKIQIIAEGGEPRADGEGDDQQKAERRNQSQADSASLDESRNGRGMRLGFPNRI